MKINFIPKYRKVIQMPEIFHADEIKETPMLFQTDYEFAMKNGGELTSLILDYLLDDEEFERHYLNNPYNLIIDSRVNLLTKGVYPSIPGWHCDDVPRKNRYSQPNFKEVSEDITHFLVVISDNPNVSGTEFITSSHKIDIDQNNVWYSLNKKVMNLKNYRSKRLKSGEILQFNQLAIHRATPALKYGWRLFFRASFTYRKPTNEIRNQTQVYYDVNNAGW